MSKNVFITKLLLPALIIIILSGLLSGAIISAKAEDEKLYDVMFSIPTGENGIHYEGGGAIDSLTWGPAAFTISNDGSFWIADTAGNRLLHYSLKGDFLEEIDLEELIVGATDLVVNNDVILVLDQSSLPPKVLRLTVKGDLLGSYDLPKGLYLEDGLTGISLGEQGELLVERGFGERVTQLLNEKGNLIDKIETNGYFRNSILYSANTNGLASANPKHGTINIGSETIEIDTTNDLGGIHILGFGVNEDFYVILEELALNPAIQVDQTIRHYDKKGYLLGISRMPLDEQYTYVAQNLAIGPDGNIYALATRPDHVDILRLNFFQKLSPILRNPSVEANSYAIQGEESIALACVTREKMINIASGYKNNSKDLNSTNINGACTGRLKPRYLTNPGTYSSVSYDWGGFESVSQFNAYMTSNYQAGDINTTNEYCDRGVDCSGFASRVWQLTQHYSSCALETVSTSYNSPSYLLMGDILNKCGVHTVVFYVTSGGNVIDYEATTLNQYDRVVYLTSAWSRFGGYSPRYYNNVCQ